MRGNWKSPDMELKKIKIPKIGEKQMLKLYVNRTEIVETRDGYQVTLKSGEEVHGMKIPANVQMWVPLVEAQFSSRPYVHLFSKEANGFLRMLYFDVIRNKK